MPVWAIVIIVVGALLVLGVVVLLIASAGMSSGYEGNYKDDD